MSETYVIQKGDTGLSIARKVYGHISWNNRELDAIKEANGITKENFKEIFKPGNTLVIPPLKFEKEKTLKNKLSYGLFKHDDILEITPLTENHTITLQGSDAVIDFIENLLNCYQTGNKSQSSQMQEASLDGALVNKFLQ